MQTVFQFSIYACNCAIMKLCNCAIVQLCNCAIVRACMLKDELNHAILFPVIERVFHFWSNQASCQLEIAKLLIELLVHDILILSASSIFVCSNNVLSIAATNSNEAAPTCLVHLMCL